MTKENSTYDVPDDGKIGHQLCWTCLESIYLCNTIYRSIQYAHNEALWIATRCHKMSNINHLHADDEMLKVSEHSKLPSAQYLDRCLELEHVCHSIITRDPKLDLDIEYSLAPTRL